MLTTLRHFARKTIPPAREKARASKSNMEERHDKYLQKENSDAWIRYSHLYEPFYGRWEFQLRNPDDYNLVFR